MANLIRKGLTIVCLLVFGACGDGRGTHAIEGDGRENELQEEHSSPSWMLHENASRERPLLSIEAYKTLCNPDFDDSRFTERLNDNSQISIATGDGSHRYFEIARKIFDLNKDEFESASNFVARVEQELAKFRQEADQISEQILESRPFYFVIQSSLSGRGDGFGNMPQWSPTLSFTKTLGYDAEGEHFFVSRYALSAISHCTVFAQKESCALPIIFELDAVEKALISDQISDGYLLAAPPSVARELSNSLTLVVEAQRIVVTPEPRWLDGEFVLQEYNAGRIHEGYTTPQGSIMSFFDLIPRTGIRVKSINVRNACSGEYLASADFTAAVSTSIKSIEEPERARYLHNLRRRDGLWLGPFMEEGEMTLNHPTGSTDSNSFDVPEQ